MRRVPAIACSGLLLATAACVGNIGGGAPEPAGASCAETGPSPLRRLTAAEYNATVRDLLADTSAPADAFPPDGNAQGFSNDASSLIVTPLLAEGYMHAAEDVAARAVAYGLGPSCAGLDETACAIQFIESFGTRAFRHPLSPSESSRLLDAYLIGRADGDFTYGIQSILEAMLQSPQFLYRVERGRPGDSSLCTSWEVASRLSYFLWGTMPDAPLFAAAAADALSTPDEIAAQARRMLEDPRSHAVVADFHRQWLGLNQLTKLEKDASLFPWFAAARPLMLTESEMFLDHVFWEGKGTLDEMLTAPYTYMNGALANVYGVEGVTGEDFVRVPIDPTERLGILTQPALLSITSHANQTSPVRRGKLVRERLLCMKLPPPPPNVKAVPPEPNESDTTRERFAKHSSDPACSGCHHLMDPIGLGLENYDASGQFRETENGRPIDATGEVEQSDIEGPFVGGPELAKRLADSAEAEECVVQQWFRYAFGRASLAADDCTLAALETEFAASGYRMPDLLVAITKTDAFRRRATTPAQPRRIP